MRPTSQYFLSIADDVLEFVDEIFRLLVEKYLGEGKITRNSELTESLLNVYCSLTFELLVVSLAD